MNMLFRFLIALLFSTYLSFGHAQVIGDSYASAKTNKEATVTFVYNGVYGFIEKGKDGKEKGLLVDLMNGFERYVLEEKGITVKHRFMFIESGSFPAFIEQIKNSSGGVFGLSNVSINEERKRTFNFSTAFIDNVSILVSHNSLPTLAAKEEIRSTFKGLTAYTIKATTYEQRLKEIKKDYLPTLKLTYESSGADVMQKVASNKQSFAVLDLNYYLEVISNKYPIKRQQVFDRKDDRFGIIMPKDNDWHLVLNEFLNSGFLQSEEYSKIIANNLGGSALRLLDSLK